MSLKRPVLYQVRSVSKSYKSGRSQPFYWPHNIFGRTIYVLGTAGLPVEDLSVPVGLSEYHLINVLAVMDDANFHTIPLPACNGDYRWVQLLPKDDPGGIYREPNLYRVSPIVGYQPAWDLLEQISTNLVVRSRLYNMYLIGDAACESFIGMQLQSRYVDYTFETLDAPPELSITRSNGSIDMDWIAPDGVVALYEYSIDSGLTWRSTGSTNTNHTIYGMTNGRKYNVAVRAASKYDFGFLAGHPSNIVTATPTGP